MWSAANQGYFLINGIKLIANQKFEATQRGALLNIDFKAINQLNHFRAYILEQ
jgi:hypothetical protein